jgi:hypothetical protein
MGNWQSLVFAVCHFDRYKLTSVHVFLSRKGTSQGKRKEVKIEEIAFERVSPGIGRNAPYQKLTGTSRRRAPKRDQTFIGISLGFH